MGSYGWAYLMFAAVGLDVSWWMQMLAAGQLEDVKAREARLQRNGQDVGEECGRSVLDVICIEATARASFSQETAVFHYRP